MPTLAARLPALESPSAGRRCAGPGRWAWRLGLLLLALLAGLPAAHAGDLITARAVVEDPGGRLGLDEVQNRPAKPIGDTFSGGYSASAFWIRLVVAPHPGTPAVLRMLPGYLDELLLFDPAAPHAPPQAAGDRYGPPPGGYTSLAHTITLPPSAEPRVLWLRLHTTSTSLLQVRAWTLAEAIAIDLRNAILQGLLVAVLVLFALWAVLQWRSNRGTLMAVHAVQQLVGLVYGLGYTGYLRLMFADGVPAPWLDRTTSLMHVCIPAITLLAHRAFLQQFEVARWGERLLAAMASAWFVEVLLMAAGHTRWALHVNMVVVMALSPAMLLVALSARVWRHGPDTPAPLPRAVLIGYYLVLNVCTVIAATPALGLLPGLGADSSVQALPLYASVSGCMVFVMVQVGQQRLRRQHAEARRRLEAERQLRLAEQARRAEQAEFVDMMTHELKTPLAVVRLALDALHAQPQIQRRADEAVAEMNAVVERCAWAQRMDHPGFRPQCQPVDLAGELQRLAAPHARVRLVMPALPPVVSDPLLLRTVVGNLIDNALRYGDPGAAVLVVASVDEPDAGRPAAVRVTVRNAAGPAGRPDPQRVFARYYRAAGARRIGGSGLGLHLSARIAGHLGGELRLLPGGDDVGFQLWLPR